MCCKGFTHISAVFYQRSGYQQRFNTDLILASASKGNVSTYSPFVFTEHVKKYGLWQLKFCHAFTKCLYVFMYVMLGSISAIWFVAQFSSIPAAQLVEQAKVTGFPGNTHTGKMYALKIHCKLLWIKCKSVSSTMALS